MLHLGLRPGRNGRREVANRGVPHRPGRKEPSSMRRMITSCAVVAAICLVVPGRPSIEDVFVATTEAAADSEGAVCLTPEGLDTSEVVSGLRSEAASAFSSQQG